MDSKIEITDSLSDSLEYAIEEMYRKCDIQNEEIHKVASLASQALGQLRMYSDLGVKDLIKLGAAAGWTPWD